MQLHLNEISKSITKGYLGLIVMDKAGWHLCKDLKVPNNIEFLFLPPYSPELNPMEQVFQQLRKLKLSNSCYENHDEINEACVIAWNSFVEKKGNIKKLALRDWANAY